MVELSIYLNPYLLEPHKKWEALAWPMFCAVITYHEEAGESAEV